ncbi:MAG: hypothetical protein JWO91_3688 [Acidobacteriaceae bacterium]|jgi:hypothetical protein|nr:hypothetical protein [Acidobacteriaceae bacterium]
MGISQIDQFRVELLDSGKGNPAEIHRGPKVCLSVTVRPS